MYFSNIIGVTGEFERKVNNLTRGGFNISVPVVIETDESASASICYVRDGKLVVGETETGKNVNALIGESDEIIVRKKGATPLKYSDVEETEENPIITVLCNRIAFYSGVKTLLKVIFINEDMMLVTPIFGAVKLYVGEEGIPLQRCNRQVLESKDEIVMSPSKLRSYLSMKSKSGVDLVYEYAMCLYMDIKGTLTACKVIEDECICINPEKVKSVFDFEEAQENERRAKAEAKALEEEEKDRKWKEHLAKERERKAKEEQEAVREKAKKKASKYTGEVDISGSADSDKGQKRSQGADFFLKMLGK